MPTRRQFLAAAGAAVAAGLAGAGCGAVEPYWLRQKDYVLESDKWPQDQPPLKIAIATDLHVGCPSVSLERLEEITKRLNNMGADMILLLGDILRGEIPKSECVPPELIGNVFKNLHAPYGVHGVLGNHDWARDGNGLWKAFEKAGLRPSAIDPIITIILEGRLDDKNNGLTEEVRKNISHKDFERIRAFYQAV